jgi:RHS repeat-associated protein
VRRLYSYDISYDDATGNVTSKKQKDWQIKDSCTSKCKEKVYDDTTFDLGTFSYSADEQHQAVTIGSGKTAETLTHDLDGNVTAIRNPDYLREMSWDANGKMSMIVDRPNGKGGKPTYYTYDWQGERAIETKETGRIWTVNPWITVKDGTVWKNVVADGHMLATKFLQKDAYEHKYYFMHRDLQGSTNIVTDRTGEMFQHHEYLPNGAVWVDEKSTIFRTPYQYAGEYFDEDHALSDLGQRWYDARRAMVYGVDPAVFNDPATLVDEPGLAAPYTYANSNPVRFTDPDGAKPQSVDPKVTALLGKFHNVDDDDSRTPLSAAEKGTFEAFFAAHEGLRGKATFTVMDHADGLRKLQKISDMLDMKPLIEIKLKSGEDGTKVENVKFSFGMGPRIKKVLNEDRKTSSGSEDSGSEQVGKPGPEASSMTQSASNASPAEQAHSPTPKAEAAPTESDGGSE